MNTGKENLDIEFHKVLKDHILKKIKTLGRSQKEESSLVLKAGILFLLWIFLYGAYLFLGGMTLMLNVSLSILWALVMVSIQMSVMHDASHGSSSNKKWVNNLLLNSISFLGGSPSLWVAQHCQAHHSFTNVPGKDHDINTNGLLRLCSSQEYKPLHRYQYIYAWLLYPLFVLSWIWWGDFRDIKNNTYGLSKKRLKYITLETVLIKIWHVGLFIVVPLLTIKSLPLVLVGYFISFAVMGFIMVVVFQLAHVTSVQQFASEQDFKKSDWACFQLASTANFAPHNKLLTWYLGGLNHQIEHHIFPYLSHTHYPRIRDDVKNFCNEHGVEYHVFPTLFAAVRQHQYHLMSYGVR